MCFCENTYKTPPFTDEFPFQAYSE